VEALSFEIDPSLVGVSFGVVRGAGLSVAASPAALSGALDEAIARATSRSDDEPARRAVRDMLRHGRYKPTGRQKPASEYLLGAAREGRFPRISNLVDINNLVSLESLLPISVVDVARAGTRRFLARRGRAGEEYVFNSAGQSIALEDLLLVAALPGDVPCANPVKDSMATKVVDATSEVLAVLYAPAALNAALTGAAERFAALLREHAGAAEASAEILPK
jgi:DNA/RNA-binding domain of Phe-tRNA-synthetase-like protein